MTTELRNRFADVVTSEDQFRAVMGSPPPGVVKKEIAHLNEHACKFIAKTPFILISSCDSEGRMDVSPKGDPPGFVRVLDEHTLAIPDRLGNRRADTFKNLLANDRIGLLFLIPGKQETLRISGRGIIVRDATVREPMAVRGKLPDFAIVVAVEQVFFHCAKCIIRSSLWKTEAWPDLAGLPSLAETTIAAAKLDVPLVDIQAIIENDAATRLY